MTRKPGRTAPRLEQRLSLGAVVVGLLHAVDDSVLNRQPGVPVEHGEPLRELVTEVAPTPLLLIAAGSIPGEIPVNQVYARAAGNPVELWTLPDVAHTNAIDEVATEYERRVVDHLDAALLREENRS